MIPMRLPKILQPFYCADLVRLGKNNDGGYLVNSSDIDKTDFLLSFGIGTDISFEQDFLKLKNCNLLAFDKTAKNLHNAFFVDNKKLESKNIGMINDENTAVFSDIIQRIQGKIFLKCDIDGVEFEIFDDIINCAEQFSGIVLEIHDIAQYENFNRLTDFMCKLKMNLVHVHINNYSYVLHDSVYTPNVIELTFSSSNNVELKRTLTLPHYLDQPCNPIGLDFSIDF